MNNFKRKNLCLKGVPEDAERNRGTESVFEEIIAENFPNMGKESGMQILEIEFSPYNQRKPFNTLMFHGETSKFQR